MSIRRRLSFTVVLPCLLAPTAPMVFAVDPESTPLTPYEGEGCWVQIFKGNNYRPPTARLVGPTFLHDFRTGPVVSEDLQDVGGESFLADIDSLIVGPRAVFLVYASEHFSGQILEFAPGQHVPDLRVTEYADKAKSAKLRCEPDAE